MAEKRNNGASAANPVIIDDRSMTPSNSRMPDRLTDRLIRAGMRRLQSLNGSNLNYAVNETIGCAGQVWNFR